MTFDVGDTGEVLYQANVEEGATYDVRVEQPPFSMVFSFDTSGSMGPYLEFVYQALRAFTADVTPGEEAVSVIPFEERAAARRLERRPLRCSATRSAGTSAGADRARRRRRSSTRPPRSRSVRARGPC